MTLSCCFGHKDHELFAHPHGLARMAAAGLPSSCGCFLSHAVWIGSSSHSRCYQSFCPQALARAIAWCVSVWIGSISHRSARARPQISMASSRPPVPQASVEIKKVSPADLFGQELTFKFNAKALAPRLHPDPFFSRSRWCSQRRKYKR